MQGVEPTVKLDSPPGAGAIINQIYALTIKARHSAVFLCHPDVKRLLATLKDREGRSLLRQGLSHGDSDRLMDFPIHYDLEMPEDSLIFGDFVNGYEILIRPYVTILVDPFTRKPNVSFVATMKIGGRVLDPSFFDLMKW